MIGAISLGRPGAKASLGYWLGQSYWGKGYMSEAAGLVLDWFFSVSDAQTIESGALDENPASLKVLAKLGFGRGVRRDLHIRARGAAMPSTRVFLDRKDFVARVAV